MATITGQREMKQFLYYYIHHEKPNQIVEDFLLSLLSSSFCSSITFLYSLYHTVEEYDVLVQANGTMLWKNMDSFEEIPERCRQFIENTAKRNTVRIYLPPRAFAEERNSLSHQLSALTVGQYAFHVRHIERKEELFLQKFNWNVSFAELQKQKIDDVLDRYDIQKNMYAQFSDPIYKRKMERWERVFQALTSLGAV